MVSGWYQQPPHDEGDRAVVRLGEPIRSAYVLIERDHLANVTSLERWTRPHPGMERGLGQGKKAGGSEVGSRPIGSGRLRLIRGGVF